VGVERAPRFREELPPVDVRGQAAP
jgi:hypothetical protein